MCTVHPGGFILLTHFHGVSRSRLHDFSIPTVLHADFLAEIVFCNLQEKYKTLHSMLTCLHIHINVVMSSSIRFNVCGDWDEIHTVYILYIFYSILHVAECPQSVYRFSISIDYQI